MARYKRVNVDEERAKRELRSASARLRRQIDSQLVRVSGDLANLVFWRAYVRRFPRTSVALACAIGVVAAASIARSQPGIPRWIARQAIVAAEALLGAELWHAARRAWQRSRGTAGQPPLKDPPPPE